MAICACHLTYATYQCLCPKGYGGSGTVGQCNVSPKGTVPIKLSASCNGAWGPQGPVK